MVTVSIAYEVDWSPVSWIHETFSYFYARAHITKCLNNLWTHQCISISISKWRLAISKAKRLHFNDFTCAAAEVRLHLSLTCIEYLLDKTCWIHCIFCVHLFFAIPFRVILLFIQYSKSNQISFFNEYVEWMLFVYFSLNLVVRHIFYSFDFVIYTCLTISVDWIMFILFCSIFDTISIFTSTRHWNGKICSWYQTHKRISLADFLLCQY